MYLYAERDAAYALSTACNELHKKRLEKPGTTVITPSRRDTSTRAQSRRGMLDNDTQKPLVHRAVRRPDHHVPLRERVRVDRDPVDRHFGNGTVLLAHGQLFQSI